MERSNYKYRERFLIPYRDGYKTVSVNDICYVFTENKIVRLFLRDGTSEAVSVSMDDLEKQTQPRTLLSCEPPVHCSYGKHQIFG